MTSGSQLLPYEAIMTSDGIIKKEVFLPRSAADIMDDQPAFPVFGFLVAHNTDMRQVPR